MQTQNLVSVLQAATLANVSTRTIYYHIHKSKKLQYIYGDKQYYVNAAQLKTLYKAASAGTKQKLSTTTYCATTQQQVQQLIAQAQEVLAKLQQFVV